MSCSGPATRPTVLPAKLATDVTGLCGGRTKATTSLRRITMVCALAGAPASLRTMARSVRRSSNALALPARLSTRTRSRLTRGCWTLETDAKAVMNRSAVLPGGPSVMRRLACGDQIWARPKPPAATSRMATATRAWFHRLGGLPRRAECPGRGRSGSTATGLKSCIVTSRGRRTGHASGGCGSGPSARRADLFSSRHRSLRALGACDRCGGRAGPGVAPAPPARSRAASRSHPAAAW